MTQFPSVGTCQHTNFAGLRPGTKSPCFRFALHIYMLAALLITILMCKREKCLDLQLVSIHINYFGGGAGGFDFFVYITIHQISWWKLERAPA